MFRQSCSISRHRSDKRRRRSGVLRPRNFSGIGLGLARRAASSFWPKNQPIRAICTVSKASLSKASGITRWRYSAGAGLQYNSQASRGRVKQMPRFRTLDDLDVAGKRVLLRADLNVPVKGGRVTVMSHFGRPKGPDPALSLRPLVEPLSRAIGGWPVHFAPDCIGPEAERVVATLKPGEVALLENLRFHPEEEKNDPGFAKQLAELGDAYVVVACSAEHRAHASIEALAHLLPAAAGKNMQQELEALGAALEHPQKPVIALVGGAKVSTKLDLLKFMTGKVDKLAIGGAMANTFLYAQGKPVGRSLCEKDLADTARTILAEAEKEGCEIILPEDAVTAEKLEPGVVTRTVGVNAVPMTAMILDIGPETMARICA